MATRKTRSWRPCSSRPARVFRLHARAFHFCQARLEPAWLQEQFHVKLEPSDDTGLIRYLAHRGFMHSGPRYLLACLASRWNEPFPLSTRLFFPFFRHPRRFVHPGDLPEPRCCHPRTAETPMIARFHPTLKLFSGVALDFVDFSFEKSGGNFDSYERCEIIWFRGKLEGTLDLNGLLGWSEN